MPDEVEVAVPDAPETGLPEPGSEPTRADSVNVPPVTTAAAVDDRAFVEKQFHNTHPDLIQPHDVEALMGDQSITEEQYKARLLELLPVDFLENALDPEVAKMDPIINGYRTQVARLQHAEAAASEAAPV